MRVLTWNLFHGRSLPAAGRPLLAELSAMMASWEWDVALLQEAPPWWPQALAEATACEHAVALTSRNGLLGARRALAQWRPDLVKSNGGGCNAVLSRLAIAEHKPQRLRLWPERRVAQLVRLRCGFCVANIHASTRRSLAREELARLWALAMEWSGTDPLLLGGDLNLEHPPAPAGAVLLAQARIDFLFGCRLQQAGPAERPSREAASPDGGTVTLSDHEPLIVPIEVTRRSGSSGTAPRT